MSGRGKMKTINNFIKIIIFLVVLNGGILLITYVLTPKIPSFYWEKHMMLFFLEQASHIVLLIL